MGDRAGHQRGSGLTCILGEAGAVAVTLSDSHPMLGAHSPPVGGEGACGGGGLALGQCPLAGVAVPGTVCGLYILPGHWVYAEGSGAAIPC